MNREAARLLGAVRAWVDLVTVLANLGSGEDAELSRQIAAKRQELRDSSASFLGTDAPAAETEQEDRHLAHILSQLDTLRQALERAR